MVREPAVAVRTVEGDNDDDEHRIQGLDVQLDCCENQDESRSRGAHNQRSEDGVVERACALGEVYKVGAV